MKDPQIFITISEGLPYVKSSGRDVLNEISLQNELINNNIPYSLHAENLINTKLKQHIDICISNMNILTKCIGRQDFPIEHFLLRKYRDGIHHNNPVVFKPIRFQNNIDFLYGLH